MHGAVAGLEQQCFFEKGPGLGRIAEIGRRHGAQIQHLDIEGALFEQVLGEIKSRLRLALGERTLRLLQLLLVLLFPILSILVIHSISMMSGCMSPGSLVLSPQCGLTDDPGEPVERFP